MSATEFDIIRKYFSPDIVREDVKLGVGDDCALVEPPVGKTLAITVDTLVSGVHFPTNTSPGDIAYKAIAVSLSDLAAMGAQPAWLTLALTLPEIDETWLKGFADSFSETASDYNCQLIGGDTTKGPLAITVQATGFVKPDQIMRRDTAQPDDKIYVTGTLGDAALGLRLLTQQDVSDSIESYSIQRLNRPEPRVEFGLALAKYCRCAIDISDGLNADLGHILTASSCGADVELDNIPLSEQICQYFNLSGGSVDWGLIFSGDDYELCFVVPEKYEAAVYELAENKQIPVTCIGSINDSGLLQWFDKSGAEISVENTGYKHF